MPACVCWTALPHPTPYPTPPPQQTSLCLLYCPPHPTPRSRTSPAPPSPAVPAPVGQQYGGAADTEEAVGYHHGLVVAQVPNIRGHRG